MREWTSGRIVRRSRYGVAFACSTALAAGALLVGTQWLPAMNDIGSLKSALTERPSSNPVGFAKLAQAVKPAVVSVRARTVDEPRSSGGRTQRSQHETPGMNTPHFSTSQGSGFLITGDGYVVTNNHVISGSTTAEVSTDDGMVYPARVVGADPTSDLALLKVDGKADFAHVRFADTPPHVGDWIISIGNPFGLGGTVTAGIVSARGRDVEKDSYEDLVQIDAPVNRGNSGGPSFDVSGNVIGVNTMIISPTGGSVGIAFAIPSDRAKPVIEQLKAKGSVTRGWLGLQVQSISPEIADSLGLAKRSGVLVADVAADSPAAEAGIIVGDVVNGFEGDAVNDSHDFSRKLGGASPGNTVRLDVLQKGRQLSIATAVGQAPSKPKKQPPTTAQSVSDRGSPADLGLALVTAGPREGFGTGVMVVGVDPGGLAAGRGISPGDVILNVAEQETATPEDVYKLVADARNAGRHSVLMRVKSGASTQFVALPIV